MKECNCCGAKLVEYKHSLTPKLLEGLIILANAGDGCHNLTDIGLTHNQRCNFQKLKYWGLVRKHKNEWEITLQGKMFLTSKIQLHKSVYTFRGRPKRLTGDNLYIHELIGGWQQRQQYAQEAIPHVT